MKRGLSLGEQSGDCPPGGCGDCPLGNKTGTVPTELNIYNNLMDIYMEVVYNNYITVFVGIGVKGVDYVLYSLRKTD